MYRPRTLAGRGARSPLTEFPTPRFLCFVVFNFLYFAARRFSSPFFRARRVAPRCFAACRLSKFNLELAVISAFRSPALDRPLFCARVRDSLERVLKANRKFRAAFSANGSRPPSSVPFAVGSFGRPGPSPPFVYRTPSTSIGASTFLTLR